VAAALRRAGIAGARRRAGCRAVAAAMRRCTGVAGARCRAGCRTVAAAMRRRTGVAGARRRAGCRTVAAALRRAAVAGARRSGAVTILSIVAIARMEDHDFVGGGSLVHDRINTPDFGNYRRSLLRARQLHYQRGAGRVERRRPRDVAIARRAADNQETGEDEPG